MDDEYSREQERRRQITMADPDAAKAKVIELRQQRKTYRQIGNTLGIGETTARLWADSEARDRDLQRRRDKYKSNPEPKI